MRSVPLVLMIFWFYFLVPYIGQWITGAERPIQVGYFTSSLVTFTLFEAALFLRDHARRDTVDSARPGRRGAGARHDLSAQP